MEMKNDAVDETETVGFGKCETLEVTKAFLEPREWKGITRHATLQDNGGMQACIFIPTFCGALHRRYTD